MEIQVANTQSYKLCSAVQMFYESHHVEFRECVRNGLTAAFIPFGALRQYQAGIYVVRNKRAKWDQGSKQHPRAVLQSASVYSILHQSRTRPTKKETTFWVSERFSPIIGPMRGVILIEQLEFAQDSIKSASITKKEMRFPLFP